MKRDDECKHIQYILALVYLICGVIGGVEVNRPLIHTLHAAGLLRFRGCRGGANKQQPIRPFARPTLPHSNLQPRPLVIDILSTTTHTSTEQNCECLELNQHKSQNITKRTDDRNFTITPSLYVLNPTSLSKPHAHEQLQADLIANNTDHIRNLV